MVSVIIGGISRDVLSRAGDRATGAPHFPRYRTMWNATPLFRLYARRRRARLARLDAATTQRRVLGRLLRRARRTRFGRDHGFARIDGVEAFQAAVPLRRYEEAWRDYWEPAFPILENVTWPGRIPFFALSSGTTSGRTKHIPVTWETIAANRRAALDVLAHHVALHADSRVLGGRSLMLGGSTDLETLAPDVLAGDLSGIAAATVPRWAASRAWPPRDIALEADWDRKIDLLARRSLDAGVRAISGTPPWLLMFFERLASMHGDRGDSLDAWYPDLELLIHGGVAFTPYARRFERLLSGTRIDLREVYAASEGFFAVQDGSPGTGLALRLDDGIFYELVPVEELGRDAPTRHWAATAETGAEYAIAVSTNAGLWSHLVGDTVRVVGRDPLRLVVTGRTTWFLSAFGEHLHGDEVEAAVAQAAEAIGRDVTDYSVGTLFAARGEAADGHLYVVELDAPAGPDGLASFAATLDSHLADANADYLAHRRGGQLAAPRVHEAPPGTFAAWMRKRGRLGGQNKVPRIVNDGDLFDDLRRFVGDPTP